MRHINGIFQSISNIYIYIYIYIYIDIYCHPQSECFVVSQLFSVARHIRRLKLKSKPVQLYNRLCILPISQQVSHVSTGIIRHYVVAFVCLHFALPDTRVLYSFEEFCITRVAVVNSLVSVFNPRNVYIIFINPSARAGYDTRSIFKAEFNRFEFRVFLLLD